MKKIAFVTCSMVGGGAQRVIAILSGYLVQKGYSVSVIVTSDAVNDYELDGRVKYLPLDSGNLAIRPAKQLSRFHNLYRELKRGAYDYVAAFLPTTCIYVAMCKVMGCNFQYIASERMDPRQDPANRILRKLRDWSYRKADKLVFQTEDARDSFSDAIREKSTIIGNPLNSDLPQPFRGEREKRIVSVIRLEKQKNPRMLIEAFRRFHQIHSDYTLEIYGKGSMEEELREYIDKCGLRDCAFLMGFHAAVYECIKTASFFALSSDYEGVSNSMLEALGLGLPVISTDHPIGGARIFIRDGINGYLTPVGDAEAFSDAMAKVAELSNAEYQEMSESAAQVRNELAVNIVCKQWEEYITVDSKEKDN